MKLYNLGNDTTDNKRRLNLILSLQVNILGFFSDVYMYLCTYNSDPIQNWVSCLLNLKEPEANSNSGSEVGHFLTRGCTLQNYFTKHCLLKESHGLKRVVQESCFENENIHEVIYVRM